MSIDFLFADFDRLIQSAESVHRLRRFILDLAVRGKLVPQDPNDEPASELMKRIAAEKARLVKAGEIRKEKSLPEIAPDEIPFGAPQGWEWVRLASSTIIVQGFAFSSGDFATDPDAGYPLIKIGDIGTSTPKVFIKEPHDPAYLVNRGDILVGLSGSIKCAIWEGPTALLNQRIARIAPSSGDLLSAWLLFGVNVCIDKWKDETSKLTVQNVKARQLYESLIPLPPVAEQHRIVAKVNELMALCDRLEAARAEREATRDRLATASLARLNVPDPDPAMFQHDVAFSLKNLTPLTTRPDQIKALRQTILNLAVRGKLVLQDPNDEPASELLKRIAIEKARLVKAGKLRAKKSFPPFATHSNPELPSGWRLAYLGDVIKLCNGFAFKSEDFQSRGIPVIRIGDLRGGEVDLSNAVCVSEKTAVSVGQEIWIPVGALLIAMSGATTGKVAFNKTGQDLLLNQRVGRIETFLINANFVRFFFETIIARNLEISFGTAIPNLSAKQINETVIPLPPLAEQHRIVSKVDELTALCDRLEASLVTGGEARGRLVEAVLYEPLAAGGDRRRTISLSAFS